MTNFDPQKPDLDRWIMPVVQARTESRALQERAQQENYLQEVQRLQEALEFHFESELRAALAISLCHDRRTQGAIGRFVVNQIVWFIQRDHVSVGTYEEHRLRVFAPEVLESTALHFISQGRPIQSALLSLLVSYASPSEMQEQKQLEMARKSLRDLVNVWGRATIEQIFSELENDATDHSLPERL